MLKVEKNEVVVDNDSGDRESSVIVSGDFFGQEQSFKITSLISDQTVTHLHFEECIEVMPISYKDEEGLFEEISFFLADYFNNFFVGDYNEEDLNEEEWENAHRDIIPKIIDELKLDGLKFNSETIKKVKKSVEKIKRKHIIEWNMDITTQLYKGLVEKFGPYLDWEEKGYPSKERRKEYFEYLDNFASYASFLTPGANGEKAKGSAVEQQIAFAITPQKFIKTRMKTLLFNKIAAYDQKFINKLPEYTQ